MRDHVMEMKMKQSMQQVYKDIFETIGKQSMQQSGTIFKLQVWVDVVLSDILSSRGKLLWILVLLLIRPKSARSYVCELYDTRINGIISKSKEAECSSSKVATETPADGSKKVIQSGKSESLEK